VSERSERTADPAAVCVAYLAAFATGDPDLVVAHVAEDFVNEHTAALGEGSVGRDEYRRRLPGFLASMPGLAYEIEDVVSTRDRVMIAYTLHTRVNERDIAVRGVMRFLVHHGLITHRVDYWDSTVFRRQAGLE
jgi:ketosteroid isomerase-like protein